MEVFSEMLTLQLQLFLLIAAGVLFRKLGQLDDRGRKALSTLLVNLILPCNIVVSFLSGNSVTDGFVKNCLLAFLICAAIQAVAILASRVIFRRYPRAQKSVISYGMICSNSSFIGLPVAEALYGTVGVMYTSIFQIPVRFTMWTAGMGLFSEVAWKKAVKNWLSTLVFWQYSLDCCSWFYRFSCRSFSVTLCRL